MTLILFSPEAASRLSHDLASAGIQTYEALAISEVLALAHERPYAPIVVAPEIECERAKLILQHHPILRLKPNATANDVIWELDRLFPHTSTTL